MAQNEFEAIVVGGGAAGIAGARRLRNAGIDALLVEARPRLGGRAFSVTEDSGVAIDLGCGWLHSADRNPWAPIAEAQGRSIDKTAPPWARASGQIGMSRSDRAAFAAALQAFRARTEAIGEDGSDRPASSFLDAQSPWNGLIDAASTYYSGAELDKVSARDLARYDDSGVNWRIVEGYGRTIADHAIDLPIRLDCQVLRIDRRGKQLRVETTSGSIGARAAIVTLPSNILAEQPGLFLPALPDKTQAAADLPLGLADKLFLSLANPEPFEAESRAFGAQNRAATGAYHFRPFGRPQIECYFGGALAADLERGGKKAFFDFAAAELAGLLGSDFSRRIKPLHSHSWKADPFARGSYSCALPGKADSRAALAAPVDDRLFFAGEACSSSDFSTAHGAYLTGVAAAEQAIFILRGDARKS
jgi:monoamine oxidase